MRLGKLHDKIAIPLITAIVLLTSPLVVAETYYVDATNGNDSNSGTSETAAWKTIGKINSMEFLPGDMILFKRGEIWREELVIKNDGVSGNPITFGAYGTGEKPVITAADLASNWTRTPGYDDVWQTPTSTETRIVIFDGNLGKEGNAAGNLNKEFEWAWQANVLYVFSTSNPAQAYTNPGVEIGARNNAIWGHNKNYYTMDGLDLRGANGKMNSGAGLLLSGDYVTVKNCTFMHNFYAGIHAADAADNGTVESCEIHHNLINGVYLENDNSWSMSNCTVHSNGLGAKFRSKPVVKFDGRSKTEVSRVAGDTESPRPPTNVRVVVGGNPDPKPTPVAGFVKRRGNGLVVGENRQPLYLRGVNFAGYFMISADGEWYTEGVERGFPSPDTDIPIALHEVWKDWFKERHFAVVAQTGFNVIRVPLTYRIFEDNSAPGRFKPEGWSFVDKYIGWAKQHNVYLILDMHIAQGGLQTSEAGTNLWKDTGLQQRYRNLWKAIASRYANETILAGYDLLNEPHPASSATDGNGDNRQWKTLAQQVVDDIRSVDRNHLIVVEAVNWIDDGTLSDWTPEVLENFQFLVDDDNVMYDFHFYFPFDYVFTADPDRYPSAEKVPTMEGTMATFDKKYLEAELQSICRFSTTNNIPMNFGEWSGPAFDKRGGLAYVGDLISLFDQYKINWNFWSILDFYTNDAELKDRHLIHDRLNIFKRYFGLN